SGSTMTRSLQSPTELVKAHARSPLLPATSDGTPGSVTPVRRRGRVSRQTIDARYQMFGVDRPRCMSLATMAPPSPVRRPATAQLLLPRASSLAGEENHASSVAPSSAFDRESGGCAAGGAVRASNTLASGMGGTGCSPPTSGVSHSLDELVMKSASAGGSVAYTAARRDSRRASASCSVRNIDARMSTESSAAHARGTVRKARYSGGLTASALKPALTPS